MTRLVGIEKCVFVPSGGALGLILLGCCLSPLLLLGCFSVWFWVPLYIFYVLRGVFVLSLGCWLGFLCMLEALCVFIRVLRDALCFFWYIIH